MLVFSPTNLPWPPWGNAASLGQKLLAHGSCFPSISIQEQLSISAQQMPRPHWLPSGPWSTLGYPSTRQVKSPALPSIAFPPWEYSAVMGMDRQHTGLRNSTSCLLLDFSSTFLNRKRQKIYKLERKMNRTLGFQCQDVSKLSEGRSSICVPAAATDPYSCMMQVVSLM